MQAIRKVTYHPIGGPIVIGIMGAFVILGATILGHVLRAVIEVFVLS